jgi:hypothetical protein
MIIIDTPGLKIGGDKVVRESIEEMISELIAPKNRLIICIEQNIAEWANTVSQLAIMQKDPSLERTILVNSKFDNQVKKFTSAKNARRYLNGEDVPQRKKLFFLRSLVYSIFFLLFFIAQFLSKNIFAHFSAFHSTQILTMNHKVRKGKRIFMTSALLWKLVPVMNISCKLAFTILRNT